MPTYEYKCDACGHAFEKFHSITAAPIKKCPVCGKNKVRRLISTGAGLIFKGSGFYITDYRDAGYKDQAKAESGTSGDSATKTEKTDAAAKSDAPAAASSDKPAAAATADKPAPAATTSAPPAEKKSKSKKGD